MYKGIQELNKWLGHAGITDKSAKETAHGFYRLQMEHQMIRGRSREVAAITAIECAARIHGIVLDTHGLYQHSLSPKATKKTVGRMIRTLKRELGVKAMPVTAKEQISRIVGTLEAGFEVEKAAFAILHRLENHQDIVSKSPTGVAAACIYIVGKKRFTQKAICKVAGITEVTLRSISFLMYPILDMKRPTRGQGGGVKREGKKRGPYKPKPKAVPLMTDLGPHIKEHFEPPVAKPATKTEDELLPSLLRMIHSITDYYDRRER